MLFKYTAIKYCHKNFVVYRLRLSRNFRSWHAAAVQKAPVTHKTFMYTLMSYP